MSKAVHLSGSESERGIETEKQRERERERERESVVVNATNSIDAWGQLKQASDSVETRNPDGRVTRAACMHYTHHLSAWSSELWPAEL